MTLDVVYAPKKFVDANPKTTEAFLAAMEETNAFINNDKKAAAEIFVRTSKTKVTLEEVQKILDDKDAQFSTTPNKVMNFVEFMRLAGTIKVIPETYVYPPVEGAQGEADPPGGRHDLTA